MAATTIQNPGKEELYTGINNDPPTKFVPSVEGADLILPSTNVLYVQITYGANVPKVTFAPEIANASLSYWRWGDNGALTTWSETSAISASPYFVPFLAPIRQYSDIAAKVTGDAKDLQKGPSEPAAITQGASSESPASLTVTVTEFQGSGLNLNDSAVIAFSKTVSEAAAAEATSAAVSAYQATAAPTLPKSTTVGAAVGGSIGGLLIGIAAALIALACLRRRASQNSGKYAPRSRSIDGDKDARGYMTSKEMHAFDTPTAVTGWRKHLPQEKDDGTIAKTVKTIFDQIQMHVEGFYTSKPRKLAGSAATGLERVSPDGLSRKLSKAPNSLPILEGILIRWIIHRISLRSDAGESFLPFEYTKIPEQNGWHMESEEEHGGQIEESKKAFPQAFSQWRVLTAFLHPDPRADQAFNKHLDVKIDQGVRALTDAFSPWGIPGRSITNRNESLRRILQLANDAGLMLFAQPSTFVFDWSSRHGTVTVSPAFAKRLDEVANPLSNPVVLIAAKQVDA